MAARPASVVSNEVLSRANGLDQFTRRAEGLFIARRVRETDINRIYAGAFLEFCTFLERSVERLFLGLVMRRFEVGHVTTRPLVEIASESVARKVVTGERRYVDWFPMDRYTMPRAQAFLSNGEPFVSVPTSDKKALDSLYTVRNAIAHESAYALRRFRADFTTGLSLPPTQLKPGGFLRGIHGAGQTRLQYYLYRSAAVMRRLTE